MSNPWSHDERAFGDLLRQEARVTQPEFSEPLHQGICHAVRQRKADEITIQTASGSRMAWRLAPLAVAAVGALVAVIVWRIGDPAKAPLRPESPAPYSGTNTMAQLPGSTSLPGLMDRAAVEVDRLISDKLVAEQWAYLEHDALVLANAVTGGSLRGFVQPSAAVREPDRPRTRPEG